MLNTSIPLEILNLSSKKAELKMHVVYNTIDCTLLLLVPDNHNFVAFAACYTKCLIHGGRKIRHQTYIHVASFVYCDCYLSLHAGVTLNFDPVENWTHGLFFNVENWTRVSFQRNFDQFLNVEKMTGPLFNDPTTREILTPLKNDQHGCLFNIREVAILYVYGYV